MTRFRSRFGPVFTIAVFAAVAAAGPAAVAVGGLYALDRIDAAAETQVAAQVDVQESLAEQIARVEVAVDRGDRRERFLDAVDSQVTAARLHLDAAREWNDERPRARFDLADRREWNAAAAGYQTAVFVLGGLMPDYCGGQPARFNAISKMLRPDEHGAIYTSSLAGGAIAPAANLVTCYERSAEVAAQVM